MTQRPPASGWVHLALALATGVFAVLGTWQFRSVRTSVLGHVGGGARDPGTSDVRVEHGVLTTKLVACSATERSLAARGDVEEWFAASHAKDLRAGEPRGASPTRFPDRAAALSALSTVGLLAADRSTVTVESGTRTRAPETAFDALVASGRAYRLSLETRTPVPYDSLLSALAATSGGALDGVRFASLPPDARHGRAGYRLVAHDGVRCSSAGARDFGTLFDVPSVVGFLDALLSARGRAERFLTLRTFPGEARFVSGTPDALRMALTRGLLVED